MIAKRMLLSLLLFIALASSIVGQQPSKSEQTKSGDKAQSQPGAKTSSLRPAASYKRLKYPPLNRVNVPDPMRVELQNGMVVYLVEDHELPMITISALVRAGSRWEPVNKAGLAAITGTVMRTGGTPSRAGDKLDEELDRLGAFVETSIGDDSGQATVSVLKEDIDKGLTILADVLQNPAFPEDKIELAKIEQREAIARRNMDPSSIVSREFGRIIFGKDSPYGHQPEYDTINAISREDLIAFHKQFFQPENVILGAWGDFKTDEMRALIEKAFAGWARGNRPKPAPPEVDPAAKNRAGLYFISKDDVNQSQVLMGLLGGKRSDEDYYALSVISRILGGGFNSRLVNSVRTEQGLAYDVFSSWSAGWDRPGLFIAGGGTKSETTVKIIDAIKREIEKLAEAGVTDEELNGAKDGILNGFAFEFDSTGKIVQRLMNYEYYGYPRDYLQRYRENVEKVTKADVLRVAKQYLKTDQFAILVLGREKDFDKPLSSLGQVTTIDITIPKPRQEALAAATPETVDRGKKILTNVLEAMGGAALQSIKDYMTISNDTFNTPQGEFSVKVESTVRLAGKAVNKLITPVGEIVQGFDGQMAWVRTPQGSQELPASQREEVENSLFRDTFSLLQNIDSSALTIQALGSTEIDGKQVEMVAVVDPTRNRQVKLYVDPRTNLLVKKVYMAAPMGTPGEVEEIYSDYREVNGVKVPFKLVMNQNGKKLREQTIAEVKINPGVEDRVFNKP